jgi:release factor glutamine methyltransferase
MTIKDATCVSDLLDKMADMLKQSYPTQARHYARTLLAFVEARSVNSYIVDPGRMVDAGTCVSAMHYAQQLCDSVPLSRLIGVREFWSMTFALNEATLDPRPDSETVIETVLSLVTDRTQSYRLLDLGTGSGCLLLALLSEYPHATGVGVDLSPRALEAARYNAIVHGLADRASFAVSHWVEAVVGTFDLIISNPPYIALTDKPLLDANVLHHDPSLALFGGDDGLICYREIFGTVRRLLKPGGYVVVEIGHTQVDDVCAIALDAGFHHVRTVKDIEGRNRAVIFD